MYRYILCVFFSVLNWYWNGKHLIEAVKEKVISEFYMHTGMGIFFTILIVELSLGSLGYWISYNILLIKIIGFVLYIPAAYLVFASWQELKNKGKPKDEPTCTTEFINSGIYSKIRQPMTLGMTIWSIALILVFQSILALVLGLLSLILMWISAVKESEYNIKKFGDAYREYMKRVPMWNFLKRQK